MLEKLEGLPDNVMAVKATGVVTKQDYLTVLDPMIEKARRSGRRIRFIYQFAPGFERFSSGGAWEDMRIGLSDMRLFEGCAIVTDEAWLRDSIGLARLLMPCPVRVYANEEFDQAVEWLAGLPPGGVVAHQFDDAHGVLIVEPKDPVRASDFDALARTIDPWIASHGQLHGVVLHAISLPALASFSSFVQSMKFIRDHRRQIRRLALVSDSKLADLIPRLVSGLVAAEIRQYDYDQVDEALAWAGNNGRYGEAAAK